MQISTKICIYRHVILQFIIQEKLVQDPKIFCRKIFEKYLEQIISSLKKAAGYVRAQKQGGYSTCQREPETYTVKNYSETDRRQHEASSLSGGRTKDQCNRSRGNASHSVSGRCLIKLLREYWIRLHCRILKTVMKRWEMIM